MSEPIAVIIPTYNRLSILPDVVNALATYLDYDAPITYYIGVDNDRESAADVYEHLQRNCQNCNIITMDGPRRKTRRGSLGANLNMLLNFVHEKIVIQLDDDHLLTRRLCIKPYADKLMLDERAGWIRLMGVGFHRYCACLEGIYWYVNWDSPEVYITSNRPHIKRKDFHKVFGMYPEGVKLGETEEQFCHKCRDVATRLGDNAPHVLVPLDVLTESSWLHIGKSFQNTSADM